MKKRFLFILLTGLLVVNFSNIANAAIINYSFTGEITWILRNDSSGLFASNFAQGDMVSGNYTLDTTITPTYPRTGFARYSGNSFNVTIGSHNFYGSADHRVFNDDPLNNSVDGFSIINETGYTSPIIGDLVSRTFFIQFFDYSGTIFSSTDMVLAPPPLTSFDNQINGLRLDNKYDPNDYGALYFRVNTLTPTPIPGAIWLLVSGLAGLVAVRRKKK